MTQKGRFYLGQMSQRETSPMGQREQKMFETYFSYLRPELRALAFNSDENKNNPKYEKYVEAYEWLEENYSDIESTFCSQDFYFRAGYVAGYGVFKQDPDLE